MLTDRQLDRMRRDATDAEGNEKSSEAVIILARHILDLLDEVDSLKRDAAIKAQQRIREDAKDV